MAEDFDPTRNLEDYALDRPDDFIDVESDDAEIAAEKDLDLDDDDDLEDVDLDEDVEAELQDDDATGETGIGLIDDLNPGESDNDNETGSMTPAL